VSRPTWKLRADNLTNIAFLMLINTDSTRRRSLGWHREIWNKLCPCSESKSKLCRQPIESNQRPETSRLAVWLNYLSWRRRQYITPKRRSCLITPHGDTSSNPKCNIKFRIWGPHSCGYEGLYLVGYKDCSNSTGVSREYVAYIFSAEGWVK
jgi:hypothetical protein